MPHNLVAAMLDNGSRLKAEAPFSQHVPITHFTNDGYLSTKNGDHICVFRVRGVNHETNNTAALISARNSISRIIARFDTGRFSIYTHTIRRKTEAFQDIPDVRGNSFSVALDLHHRKSLSDQTSYCIDHYLAVVIEAPKLPFGLSNITKLLNSYRKDIAEERAIREADIALMNQAVNAMTDGLSFLGAERLGQTVETRKDILQYYTMLANGIWSKAPECNVCLDQAVPAGRITFLGETINLAGPIPTQNRFAAVLAISTYNRMTSLDMLDDLLGASSEYIVTSVFSPFDRRKAIKNAEDMRLKMIDSGDDAESELTALQVAKNDFASGNDTLGKHHFSISVLAETEAELATSISRAVNAMENSGFRLKREDLGMENTWWAQQPGNMGYQNLSDHRDVKSKNAADLVGFHTFDQGLKTDLPWGGPVTVFQTASQTPYNFSFHSRGKKSAGTTAVFGGTGSGKTAVVNFLLSQTRRLNTPPHIVYFDKDRGADSFIRAMDGNYLILEDGKNIGFNPFQFARDKASSKWLEGFLLRLVKEDLTPEQTKRVSDACKRITDEPDEFKTFSHFASMFRSVDDTGAKYRLIDLLAPWHGNGNLAWLFDNDKDTFDVSQSVIGFDVAALLDSEVTRSAMLDYLFYRIEQKAKEGKPLIIVLDEAWKLLDDPRFAARIKDWIKTIRKLNGIVVFMTQEPADAAKSEISETLIQTVSTKIFFGNTEADRPTYIDAFHLSETEYAIISQTEKDSRMALIKTPTGSAMVSTQLRNAETFLKVLSGTAESVKEMDALMQAHPKDWLQHFMGETHETA